MSYARARFCAALITAVIGAVLAVGAFSFTSSSERWVAFGAGCAVLCNLAIAFAVRRRGMIQRVLDPLSALVCAWAIVCSRVIELNGAGSSDAAVKWFNFAEGTALCASGLLALMLHEIALERDLDRSTRRHWVAMAPQASRSTTNASVHH